MKKVSRLLATSSPSTDQELAKRLVSACSELTAALKAVDAAGLDFAIEYAPVYGGRADWFFSPRTFKVKRVERTNTQNII